MIISIQSDVIYHPSWVSSKKKPGSPIVKIHPILPLSRLKVNTHHLFTPTPWKCRSGLTSMTLHQNAFNSREFFLIGNSAIYKFLVLFGRYIK